MNTFLASLAGVFIYALSTTMIGLLTALMIQTPYIGVVHTAQFWAICSPLSCVLSFLGGQAVYDKLIESGIFLPNNTPRRA